MLQKLLIKNFAIIHEISIDFSAGMTAITGETGAGKSILLGALQLLLGGRADTSILLDKEQKCIIEAYFTTDAIKAVATFMQQYDIDTTNELIIRREISNAGRSRAFINDTPANLQQLNELGNILVDLHRQFDTLDIKEREFKFNVVDTLANQLQAVEAYKIVYKEWKSKQTELEQLIANKNELRKEYDYLSFQYNELQTLNLQENELEQIEKDLAVMSNAESIKNALQEAQNILDESESPVLVQLKKVLLLINGFTDKIESLAPIAERLSNVLIETKDITTDIESVFNTIHYDDGKLNLLLERFNDGQRLLKKHNKLNSADLIVLQHELEQKLSFTHNLDQHIEQCNQAIEVLYQHVLATAKAISAQRSKAASYIDKEINGLLPLVGMPAARFKTAITQIECTSLGMDHIDFLFDSNKTNQFLPIAKVASGGELSRLMLCIKSLMAHATHLPTLIFDEIDTGISGEVAKQVALILQNLSNKHQIICVTHLPQIASKSNQHLFIYKSATAKGQLQTQIKYLSQQERINQIAEMLGGDKPSENAINIAKEMIQA